MRILLLALLAFASVTLAGVVAVWPQEAEVFDAVPASPPVEVAPPWRAAAGEPHVPENSGFNDALRELSAEERPREVPALLSGSVLDEAGRVPPDAELRFIPAGAPHDAIEALLEDDGRFEQPLQAGHYALEVRASGFLPLRMEGVVVASGEELRGLIMTVSRGLTLRGRVEAGSLPVEEAMILVEGNGYRVSALSAAGDFEVEGLVPGTYRVRALHPDLGSDEVYAAAGSDARLFLRSDLVSGTVVDAQGVPVRDAEVQLRMRLPGGDQPERDPAGQRPEGAPMPELLCAADLCGGTFTDAAGRFTARVPPHAELFLTAHLEGQWASVRYLDRPPSHVTLRLGAMQRLRVRVIELEAAPAVSGWVDVEDASELGYGFPGAQAMEDGIAEVSVPPGLPVALTVQHGLRIEALEPLPPNVTLRTRPARRMGCGRIYISSPIDVGRDELDIIF